MITLDALISYNGFRNYQLNLRRYCNPITPENATKLNFSGGFQGVQKLKISVK